MQVATHREPFIDIVERSVEQLGSQFLLHVVGLGDTFTGYGWKLQQVSVVDHRTISDCATEAALGAPCIRIMQSLTCAHYVLQARMGNMEPSFLCAALPPTL